jgi:parvulin-like peptidyl-prolyl isomerase
MTPARCAIALMLTCSACRPADVVAEIGARRITRDDVLERQRAERKGIDAALESLVADEKLAAEAVSRDLQSDPQIKARLQAAQRAVLIQALLEKSVPPPDDKELLAAYDRDATLEVRQLELAHIFIGIPPGASAEANLLAQGKAVRATSRLLAGEAFEAVARDVSEDTLTRDRGGLLGVVREGQVDQRIFDAAAALAPGASSAPVQTEFGFYVLKALGPMTKVKPPFSAARGQLEKAWRDQKLAALHQQIDATVQVKRFDDALAPLKREPAAKEGR